MKLLVVSVTLGVFAGPSDLSFKSHQRAVMYAFNNNSKIPHSVRLNHIIQSRFFVKAEDLIMLLASQSFQNYIIFCLYVNG